MGAALKIASGILQGRVDRAQLEEQQRRQKRAENLQNLELLSRIGDDDRFQIGGGAAPTGTKPPTRPLDVAQQVVAPKPPKETTDLTPQEEQRFQQWAKANGITDVDHPDSHYDYRGFWKETGGKAHAAGAHFPDTFKQHGHPTFSRESKYSAGPNDGGSWQGDTFTPGPATPAAPAAAKDTTPPAPPGASPLEVATLALGGRDLPVTFDPTQSKRAKKEAINKAAHARLQQSDPAVWQSEFDPTFDYAGAEREERSRSEIEDGLVASGMPRVRAHMLAKNNIDLDKRDQEKATASALTSYRGSEAADRQQQQAEKDRERMEGEASGLAQQWAIFGRGRKMTDDQLVTEITSDLKNTHPKLSYAQRAGIAAHAVQSTALTAATVGERDRGNRKTSGIKLPGGITIDADSVAGAAGAEGGAGGAGGRKPPVKETRQQVMDRMIREGRTDQEIAAEIQRRGL